MEMMIFLIIALLVVLVDLIASLREEKYVPKKIEEGQTMTQHHNPQSLGAKPVVRYELGGIVAELQGDIEYRYRSTGKLDVVVVKHLVQRTDYKGTVHNEWMKTAIPFHRVYDIWETAK